ncbi:hypothetical protein DL93DRAFT_2142829 [Clavulina sp. PMI_390]|nr:hypothetical protein DL93DRAFT_2142829 [Clavulina sp. PMI_390]
MLAIIHTLQTLHPEQEIRITTQSKWALDMMTRRRGKNEDRGYVGVSNGALIAAAIASAKARKGALLLRWSNEIEDEIGLDRAIELAEQGAKAIKWGPDPDIKACTALFQTGLRLSAATQADTYRALRKLTGTKERRTTQEHLREARAHIQKQYKHNVTDAKLWSSILKNRTLSRNVTTFLWKTLHGGHKVGQYWSNMPNGYAERAECSCGELETIDHILFDCPKSAGRYIWPVVRRLLHKKGIKWTNKPRMCDITTTAFVSIKDHDGKPRPGAVRFLQIVVTEAAFIVWKARNKRVINGDGENQDRAATRQEAVGALAKVLNQRLSDDRRLTNRIKYGRSALSRSIVLSTWSGALKNEESLPPDWLRHHGVLVGLTVPRRATDLGQQRVARL